METTQQPIAITCLRHFAQETVQSLSTAATEQNNYQIISLRRGSIFNLLQHGATHSRLVLQHARIHLMDRKTILADLRLSSLMAEPYTVAGGATSDSIWLRRGHLFLLLSFSVIDLSY